MQAKRQKKRKPKKPPKRKFFGKLWATVLYHHRRG
jgi:hypothetical protein